MHLCGLYRRSTAAEISPACSYLRGHQAGPFHLRVGMNIVILPPVLFKVRLGRSLRYGFEDRQAVVMAGQV